MVSRSPTSAARWVFLSGRFVPAARARVSVFDRGLLYGEGLFETMRAHRGVVLARERHRQRMCASGAALGIPIPDVDWEGMLGTLLARNHLDEDEAWIRVTVTGGPAPHGLERPAATQPTLLATCGPVGPEVARSRRNGIAACLLSSPLRGDLAAHKTTAYLPAVLGRERARRRDAAEGLFVRRGHLMEGTTSNLFVIRAGTLTTPPPRDILPGVTRALVIEEATARGMEVREQAVAIRSLASIEEAFLTSSVAGIVPLISIDDRPIGSGRPAALTRRLQRWYEAAVRAGSRRA